jgi:CheY-like chemotaxis protein
MMPLKLIVTTRYQNIEEELTTQFSLLDLAVEITSVRSINSLVEELKKDEHHFIITEYSIRDGDIWDISKLVNASQLVSHALPIILIKDELDTEIPTLLAKEYGFKMSSVAELGFILKNNYEKFVEIGYRRGPVPQEKPTVLVVEDDIDSAKLIQYNLRDEYLIDLVHSGEEGISLWKSKKHDLVLLDYMLPGAHGDEVLEQIMLIDKNQPVIMMTAYDNPKRCKNMILNGASEYLCKPFEMSTLASLCRLIINRSKIVHEAQYRWDKSVKLGSLLWLLDCYLSQNQLEMAKKVLAELRISIPYTPMEDDQTNLLKMGLSL